MSYDNAGNPLSPAVKNPEALSAEALFTRRQMGLSNARVRLMRISWTYRILDVTDTLHSVLQPTNEVIALDLYRFSTTCEPAPEGADSR